MELAVLGETFLLSLDSVPVILVGALLLDRLFCELRHYHPLVGFGRLADALQVRLNKLGQHGSAGLRWRGAAALIIVVGMPVGLTWYILMSINQRWLLELLGLYFCLGRRSLVEHVQAIAAPLAKGNIKKARLRTGYIVSRQTEDMSEQEICKSTLESVFENGNDACFTTLFWFVVGGLPGALAHRLVNTLDAMWGYRTPQYLYFGWAAARLDDLLAWLPARLSALSYSLVGNTYSSLRCWWTQAGAYDSPNGGPTIAAGAGALEVKLGGPQIYHGQLKPRPILGCGQIPRCADIERALKLINRALWLWLSAIWFLFICFQVVY